MGEGWVEGPEGERILERFQIGAELRQDGSRIHPVIQITTTAIWGFGGTSARLKLGRVFGNIQSVDGKDNDGRSVYERLHGRTLALFRSLITEEAAGRIGLIQPGEST